ncbi:glycosyltransferase family 9 protein [Zwartia panacis]|uniref:glycosyltransferase family 9 protein n=1 Tax=Zwartia panacis TaxID=2683345 RepID=UPI0025B2CCC3|nr:glycosyltransferase family 9 protein [Zwartia panacis]MDN4018029.1 glycosyltransferase family 9 protein [Zwartia panacis]
MRIVTNVLIKLKKVPPRLHKIRRMFFVWFYHRITLILTEQYWLIDYLPKKKAVCETVLLVRLDLIGDFVIWLDAAKELKNLYPNKRLVLYANKTWSVLATRLPYWDEVVAVDVPRLRTDESYRLKLLCATRRLGFTTVIHPTYSREYVVDLIVRASGASNRIGHLGDLNNISASHKMITDTWYTTLVPCGTSPPIELNTNAELIRKLGNINFRSHIPVIPAFDEFPHALDLPERYSVIVPGASWAPRMWPIENFVEIILYLQKQGLTTVLCGTDSEQALCKQIAAQAEIKVMNIAGKTTLLQMIEVIRHAQLVIANESSAIHIAAAVAVPSVCILGGGHFGRFLPYNPEAEDINRPKPISVFSSMECFGCRWRCHYPLDELGAVPCIAHVGTKQVIDACGMAQRHEIHINQS